jgi:hypothetical protein
MGCAARGHAVKLQKMRAKDGMEIVRTNVWLPNIDRRGRKIVT